MNLGQECHRSDVVSFPVIRIRRPVMSICPVSGHVHFDCWVTVVSARCLHCGGSPFRNYKRFVRKNSQTLLPLGF